MHLWPHTETCVAHKAAKKAHTQAAYELHAAHTCLGMSLACPLPCNRLHHPCSPPPPSHTHTHSCRVLT
jgi:hypothetical protein